MDDLATPHDAFFRETFSRREIAQDFLRHQLPAPLLAAIDLGTLEISKDTYVCEDLRLAYSDLVYRVRYGDGKPTGGTAIAFRPTRAGQRPSGRRFGLDFNSG